MAHDDGIRRPKGNPLIEAGQVLRVYTRYMQGQELLRRIEANPGVLGGKPIIRGRRIAVEHILSMLAAGDSPSDILNHYPFLDSEDIQACILYAYRVVARETIEPFPADTPA